MDSLHILFAGPLLLILAARLDLSLLGATSWAALLLFTASLLLLVRPLALLIAGWGSPLGNPKKLFMGWAAPRGMVPVALGTIFALELGAVGHADAELVAFVPLIVTLLTAGIVWLAAGPLAQRLQIVAPGASGASSMPAGMATSDE
jgi:NhaP-type Na+/H+ or K+/H+ antiporter